MKTFNYYCDESTHLENDGKPFMLIGYVASAYNQVKLHTEKIKELKAKHHFYGEVKWTKVSHSQYGFYAELIEYFFASDLQFRAVVVDKTKIQNDLFGQTFDDFYYKMYYQLLFHKINMENNFNIYLDIKDTLSAKKINTLKDLLNLKYSTIRTLQNIRSHESLLLQLADLLIGAINYLLVNERKVMAKNRLIEKMQKLGGHSLQQSTTKESQKLNLFFIDLK